jgi:hypothetical protein
MRSSKSLLLLIMTVGAAAFLYWLFIQRPPNTPGNPESGHEVFPTSNQLTHFPSHPSSYPGAPNLSSPSPTGQAAPFATTSPPPPEIPYILGSPTTTPPMEPSTLLNNMRNVLANYRSRYGGNPVGVNEEITAALNGENPNGAKFITEESGLRINGRGQLVDYWGTPFFFHQISREVMEIRSAGPDRQMYTHDDVVTK